MKIKSSLKILKTKKKGKITEGEGGGGDFFLNKKIRKK
jgi:hypothetical protein